MAAVVVGGLVTSTVSACSWCRRCTCGSAPAPRQPRAVRPRASTSPSSSSTTDAVRTSEHASTHRATLGDHAMQLRNTMDGRGRWWPSASRSPGCADKSRRDGGRAPPTLVEVEGERHPAGGLTEKAVERLGIEMARGHRARRAPRSSRTPRWSTTRTGETWVYTSPKPLTFVRSPITVTNIAGDKAFLTDGPGARHRGRHRRHGRAVRRRAGDRLLTIELSSGGRLSGDVSGNDELDRSIEPEVPLHRRRAGRGVAGRRASASCRTRRSTSSPSSRRRRSRSRRIASGSPPSEVEELVTVPLEQALNGVPDLDIIRSKSVPQLSQIVLIFEHGHRPP